MNNRLNTWTITSNFNRKYKKNENEYKFLLQDSSIKGLCHIDSQPDTIFLTTNKINQIRNFENSLSTKPYKSIEILNSQISTASVINFRNYEFLKRKIKKKKFNILEIGAGIGYLASIIKFYNKNVSYYICDLQSTLDLIYIYFKKNFPKYKIKIFNKNDQINFAKYDIILVSNHKIKHLKKKFDLIVNIDSFSEMDKKDIDFYFEYAEKNLSKKGNFFISNTYAHSNKGYNIPIDYPYKKKFYISSYSFYNPTARDNPCRYLNINFKFKKNLVHKNGTSLEKKIKRLFFYDFNDLENKYFKNNQNYFYSSFENLIKNKLNERSLNLKKKNFSSNIKILYFLNIFRKKLRFIKSSSLIENELIYFYNKTVFDKHYNDFNYKFFNSDNFIDKLKIFYILALQEKNTQEHMDHICDEYRPFIFKKYLLLTLLYLGLFDEFYYLFKKFKFKRNSLFEFLNYFNYQNKNTSRKFKHFLKKKNFKFSFKDLNQLILKFKLKEVNYKKLREYIIKYHKNYYSIGYLLKKTIFVLKKSERNFFINLSLDLRKDNLQNINFIFEILFYSNMHEKAEFIYNKYNLGKFFFYSKLKMFIIKKLRNRKLYQHKIYSEASLMINNGTTCFMPFLNVGNNNIIISKN